MKISSIESVLSRINISVGVAEGGIRVIGTGVCVAVVGRDGSFGGGEVGVPTDKTSTEKIQALRDIAISMKLVISRNHL